VDVLVRVQVDDLGELRDLYGWLDLEPDLGGRVALLERDAPPGALGSASEALQIALGSGGAVATLSAVLVAWLNTRPGQVTVRLARGEEEIEVTAVGVRALNPDQVADLTRRIAALLEGPDERG
jgi:hypothetical protein